MNSNARRGRLAVTAAGLLLAAAGAALVIVGLRAQQSPPQPPLSAARPVNVLGSGADAASPAHRSTPRLSPPLSPPRPGTGPATPLRGPVLPRSQPLALRIPAIGVRSPLRPLGLNRDGTVQVPPLTKNSYAGWYKYSPTPGSVGPSVILGHIDSAAYGPGVFFRLGALRQHDTVYITRADHTVAVFEVERVVEYRKTRFPTLQVYGNLDHAGLRLITCGGKFDFSTRNYQDNIVAYAGLVSAHRLS